MIDLETLSAHFSDKLSQKESIFSQYSANFSDLDSEMQSFEETKQE